MLSVAITCKKYVPFAGLPFGANAALGGGGGPLVFFFFFFFFFFWPQKVG